MGPDELEIGRKVDIVVEGEIVAVVDGEVHVRVASSPVRFFKFSERDALTNTDKITFRAERGQVPST